MTNNDNINKQNEQLIHFNSQIMTAKDNKEKPTHLNLQTVKNPTRTTTQFK